jgi:capsular exopolysaccharide synthesis family protein
MSFTWQDIWRIVKRWWWLAFLAVTVAAISSYRATESVTPLYFTKATLMIGRVMQDPNPNQADLSTGQQLAVTYAQMAQRETVLQGAIDSLGLEMAWGELAGRVHANIVARTQLLEVGVVDSYPPRAKALADAIAEQLVLLSPAAPSTISEEEQAFIRQQLDDLKTKIDASGEELEQLNEDLDASISARQIQDLQGQIQVLESKISNWQSTYSQLLTSVQGGDVNVLTLMEKAGVPTVPISPNVKMNVLLAAAIGLVLAVGAALLLEFADDTFRINDAGASSVMNLPLLGTVPRIPHGRCEPRSPEAEIIRQLRTKVLLSVSNGRLRSLVVTSPQPKDGKTVVTANLAVAMAGGGGKVMMVDADMRAPTLHEWFDQPNLAGLADVLKADTAYFEELLPQVLRETHVPGLEFISAGHLPLDPSILLASPNMAHLLEMLLDRYDLVLFDTPPVLAAPDSSILAMLTQGTILVISPDRTSRRAARRSRDALENREDVNLIGVALNRTSLGSYAYPYYYRRTDAPQHGFQTRLLGKLPESLSELAGFNPPEEEGYISLGELASVLGVRRDTIQRWCEEGRLPAEKQGLRWWVRTDRLHGTQLGDLVATLAEATGQVSNEDGRTVLDLLQGLTGSLDGGNAGRKPVDDLLDDSEEGIKASLEPVDDLLDDSEEGVKDGLEPVDDLLDDSEEGIKDGLKPVDDLLDDSKEGVKDGDR